MHSCFPQDLVLHGGIKLRVSGRCRRVGDPLLGLEQCGLDRLLKLEFLSNFEYGHDLFALDIFGHSYQLFHQLSLDVSGQRTLLKAHYSQGSSSVAAENDSLRASEEKADVKSESGMTDGQAWYPLLALVESTGEVVPGQGEAQSLVSASPSPQLRDALLGLRDALRHEFGDKVAGKRHWLLLDGGASPEPSSMEVGKVLQELRQRFQELRNEPGDAADDRDLEVFLRDKMRQMGFDELGSAPLLPELQREALRGLGVGIGSQMAQLLGRLAGWHGEAKGASSPKPGRGAKSPDLPTRLIRLEVGPRIAADKASALRLRAELTKARRSLGQRLGWELSGLHIALAKEYDGSQWRMLLRAEEIASGDNLQELIGVFEETLYEHAADLLTFADFDQMARQPGCKPVVRELRSQGLEKAALWTIFRKLLSQGKDLRDPLSLFERILEGSVISPSVEHLLDYLGS